ncbi:MAG TPA: molybdate ABC transporter substrate-binding protein [Acidimicrobiia bacterium]|jgi:molybdate transport system substrate-binding protein|nr:molybdate ABC transporter substrate-binding protein [Acidimicrobiia bacterium]
MTGRLAILVLVALAIGACGGDEPESLVVSAAASLGDAFVEIADAFETANPGVDVELNFGGSSSLREQILEGARIDVFASADVATMDGVVAAGALASSPVVFARNSMVLAVPQGDRGSITSLEDLADPARFVGLCNPEVPCGSLARQVLANAGVVASIDTEEPDVRALLAKIGAGELDAGIVYSSDIDAADVDGIPLDPAINVTTDYPIAVLAGAPSPDLADRFVAFVLSAGAREILAEHGFGTP